MSILVAEDEALILIELQFCLEDAGHQVFTAAHGQEAIDHIEGHLGVFNCLITDLQMPGGITGMHVIEHMRPIYPSIPMIITTALPHLVTDGWREELGVHVVPKPYDARKLVRTAHSLLAA